MLRESADANSLGDELEDEINGSEILSDEIQEKVEVMRNPVNLNIDTGSKFPGFSPKKHKTPTKSSP